MVMFITRMNDSRQVHGLRRMWKNVRSESGFTLTEVLATVIILGLVTAGMAMAVTVGVQQFNKSMALSEGQQLYSSISRLLEIDLRLAEAPRSSGPVSEYKSQVHPSTEAVHLEALDDDGNIMDPAGEDVTGYGQLALVSQSDTYHLLGKAAYNYGLRAKVKSLRYDKATSCYTVELIIGNPAQENPVVDETFTVFSLLGAQEPEN